MLNIAMLNERDRRDLFRTTAEQMHINEAVIEKDFWVCWTLDYLFHDSPWEKQLAFKGGTSLSKAYGVIQRFSEDIDLIMDWTLLGYSKNEPWQQESNTRRSAFCEKANERCSLFLSNSFVPQILKDLSARTPLPIDITVEGQDVLIHYPKAFATTGILPQIKLEIGPMAAWLPHEICSISPYAAEQFPEKFKVRLSQIRTIKAERTFWEKATILHQEAHREKDRKLLPRYSRHYYDLYRMMATPIRNRALTDLCLLADVVRFKKNFYYCAWANLETAVPGAFRLLPPEYNRAALASDYKAMKTMLFGEIPSFEDILVGLADLETALNTSPCPSD